MLVLNKFSLKFRSTSYCLNLKCFSVTTQRIEYVAFKAGHFGKQQIRSTHLAIYVSLLFFSFHSCGLSAQVQACPTPFLVQATDLHLAQTLLVMPIKLLVCKSQHKKTMTLSRASVFMAIRWYRPFPRVSLLVWRKKI